MLTIPEVEHIAELARLSLTDDEKIAFQRDLSSILDYVGKLQSVDTTGIEPTAYAQTLENVTRGDEVHGTSVATRDAIIGNFPDKQGDLLRVPAVFDR